MRRIVSVGSWVEEVISAIAPCYVEALKQTEDLARFGVLFLCISQSLKNFVGTLESERLLANIFVTIELPISKVMASTSTLIKTAAENNGAQFPALLPQILQSISLLKNWANTNFYCFKCGLRKGSLLYSYYMTSQNIITLISSVILLGIPPADPQLWILFSNSGLPEFDNPLNELKAEGLKFGNKILKHAHTVFAENLAAQPVHAYCKILYNPVFSTLVTMCMKEYTKLEERLEENATSDFVARCLGFVKHLLKNNAFYAVFGQTKNVFTIDIVMMLVKATEKEVKSVTADPSNFVNLAIDVCTRQSSKVPKTEAIGLLEGLCTHIDGSLSFTIILCTELIRYGLSSEAEPAGNYMVVSQFAATSVFIAKTPKELLVETALLVLADLSYNTHQRKDVAVLVENIMTEYADPLFGSASQLVKCRVALVIRCYGRTLYEKRVDLFERMIKFLFNGVALEKEQKAFAMQCADALKTLTEFDVFRTRLKPYITQLAIEMCKMVEVVDVPAFYELLTRTVDHYCELVEGQLLNMMGALVARVNTEYRAMRLEGKNTNMTINQCWNVIRAICEQDAFFPKYLEDVETIMLPLFEYIVKPREIDFDDDIVQVITTLIEHRQGISENMGRLFGYLVNFFDKYEKMFGSLFQTMNAYIYFGKDTFMPTNERMEYVIKICLESLFSTKSIVEMNNSEGALLMQILLQTLETKVMTPYIPIIIENLLKRLNAKPSASYLTRQIYNAILCAVCNNAEVAVAKIEELKCTEPVFLGIFQAASNYKVTYEIKVLTIGLSTLLLQPYLPGYLEVSRMAVLSTIVETLTNQTARDAKALIKADKRVVAIEDNSDSDDYSKEDFEDSEVYFNVSERRFGSDSEDDGMPREPEDDVKMTIRMLKGRIKGIDEYEFFGRVIKALNASNPEATKKLVLALPEFQQGQLKDLLQSRRITVKNREEDNNVARKILKVRKK